MTVTPPPDDALVSFERVTLDVAGRRVLADTTWTIRRGEQWAIVGPNGAGKSLLVAALCGRLRPSSGRVRHHFVQGAAETDAAYGYFRPGTLAVVSTSVVQELTDALSPYHQARWHGSFGAALPTVDEMLSAERIYRRNPFEIVEQRVDAAQFDDRRRRTIALFGIEPLLSRKLVQLSSGELRKFLMVRAVLVDPRLLVLDEPFVGLDAATRSAMPDVLDQLIATGVQLVIATARPGELPALVSHLVVVQDLGVVYVGPRTDAPLLDAAERTIPVAKPNDVPARPPRPEFDRRIPIVELSHARVRYGDAVVLDDIDFRFFSDQNWAVVGPNGAGKTALCSLILADNPQSYANDIVLFGRRRGTGESIWDVKAKLGWVSPEIVAHYPRAVTCLDVVCSGWFHTLGLYSEPSMGQRTVAEQWLARLGLSDHARMPLGALSHGQQRLVLMARALVGDPWLLVLDEPCQGLDAAHRAPLLQAVDSVASDGRSRILFVTHHLDEMPRCMTHVLELGAGKVVRAAPLVR